MNPLRGFPGHPSHPPLTDVTIGAYTFALVAAILSKLGVAEHAFAQAWWLALHRRRCSLGADRLDRRARLAEDLVGHAALADGDDARGDERASRASFFVLAIVFGHDDYTRGRCTRAR